MAELSSGEVQQVAFYLPPGSVRSLQDVSSGATFSVSGARKVAAILFKDKLRLRVVETEFEDEEEDATVMDESSAEDVGRGSRNVSSSSVAPKHA
jgi:hypothetical protein